MCEELDLMLEHNRDIKSQVLPHRWGVTLSRALDGTHRGAGMHRKRALLRDMYSAAPASRCRGARAELAQ